MRHSAMRHSVVLATMVLGVAVSFGHAAADGPSDASGVREVGTVRFIDRKLNVIQLADGTEIHTFDARMLQAIREGMPVEVDFVQNERGRNELNSIAPVATDTRVGARSSVGN